MVSTCNNLLFWFLIFLLVLRICFCSGGCIENERAALLLFKNGLTDPSNRLADWVANGSDCCSWTGVVCHHLTAHVTELHLRTQSEEEYLGPDKLIAYSEYGRGEYEEYYNKSAFGGTVSSSLMRLPQLSYLDLSFNDLAGISIPKFFGSMQSLRYLNLSNAGFYGKIPSQLGNLSNLLYLNLQQKYYLHVENLDWVSGLSSLEFLDMTGVQLRQSFDWFKVMNSLPSLVELHLSGCSLSDFNPIMMSLPNLNFSSLAVLDLSGNNFQGPIPHILKNMTCFLRELDLSSNHFNSSIPNWLYDLTHLQLLNLRDNQLKGQIPSAIRNLTSLITLDLSWNAELEFETGIPNSFKHFCNLKSLLLSPIKLNQEINDILEILSSGCVSDALESLDFVSAYNLTGHLTDRIGHFKNLRDLSLYNGDDSLIYGPMPTSFKNLCNLRSILMSGVILNQDINDVLEIMSGCVSNVLQSLRLRGSQLSGHLTDNVGYFKNLSTLDLRYNLISGPIPSSLGEMDSLVYLNLMNNRLNGSLPVSFGNLKKLEKVYISDNHLVGEVSQLIFENLTRLYAFSASRMGNSIAFRVRPDWVPPLQLQHLYLGSWNIGSQFPTWLRLLNHLTELDLSNSGISSPFPVWFWDSISRYAYFNFSHNQMHGFIPSGNFGLLLPIVDLSSNNFSGAIPHFSSSVYALDLSKNSFSGSIHNFLCSNMNDEKQMQILNLEGNLFSGEIPDCFSSWKNLEGLKLDSNKFSGNIPNSIGALNSLVSVHLRNNNLSGEVPFSIQNCKLLESLDFGENNFIGNITWIGKRFADLRILSLRANKFDGYLPKELCHSVSLHVLDLAHNNFHGAIPSCFCNFTGMATRNGSTGSFYASYAVGAFMETALLLMKGKVMEYSTNLGFVRSIDLSDNNLSGEIPAEITKIAELLSLNLSHNSLTGRIPNDIGNMKALEVIDFAHNQLSGGIPGSMSTLTFLGTLDLSYNNLSGRIPSGTQLQSFNSSSFIGNQLCGLPLTKYCSYESAPPVGAEEEDENGDGMDVWFYANMAFGFVLGFWGVIGSLILMRRWRHFYFHFLNDLWEKIWWSCYRILH